MDTNRFPVSRRTVMQGAVGLAAVVATTRPVVPGLSTKPVALRPAGFTPTVTIDPRSYLKSGQKWETVACIRPALQAALDEAHKLVVSNASARVELIIPPGVGRLTTMAPRGPINQASSTNPKGRYDRRIGLAIRASIAGRLIIRGSGGKNRASVIRLSDNARNAFWIDTDTGVEWVDTGVQQAPGVPVSRPKAPLIFRNVLFEGFAVDNNFSQGICHIVCGNVPAHDTPQRYLSLQNVHALDIDVWNVTQARSRADQDASSKAPFVYIARHYSSYEANGGPGAGKANGHAWKKWDLRGQAGRTAAHAAGWTWMRAVSFESVRAHNTNRGIILAADKGQHSSHWIDDVRFTSCEHLQDLPYNEGTVPQTSFYLGGNCQGGSGVIESCTSQNVGDDAIETGGLQSVTISKLTCINACLAGVYVRMTQLPLDWKSTSVVIRDSTFLVRGEAIKGAQSSLLRSTPIDIKFEEDAGKAALGSLKVERSSAIIDGAWTSNGKSQVGWIDKLLRKSRYGFFLAGGVVDATFTSCRAELKNVVLGSSSATRVYPVMMWQTQQTLPAATGLKPSVTLTDCTAAISNLTTKGARAEVVGAALHSSGSVTNTRFTTSIENSGTTIQRADIARIGWLPSSFTAVNAAKHTISGVSGTISKSTIATRSCVAVFDDQYVTSSVVSGASPGGTWKAPKAVDSSQGPSNAKRLTVR